MQNKKEFWHSNITDKIFEFLKELRKEFVFTLIGGWAIYFYTNEVKELSLNKKQFADFKKGVIVNLGLLI